MAKTKRVLRAELGVQAPQRMCFMSDDDGHDYLIPVDQRVAFIDWVLAGPYWEGYEGPEFDDARLNMHLCNYSFVDPQEIK